MGHGSYSSADWSRLKNSKGLSSSSTADDIFSGNKAQEKYLPRFINMRESRYSADSPQATPIIIGFDSTGSMGYLAAEIAKNALNKTATMILEKRPVTDPHLMCAAFTMPCTPLAMQVTQFEADIRVVEQLLDFVLQGGNPYSYDSLVWYFAAKHTSTDAYEKDGRKGLLFCIGDEIGPGPEQVILDSVAIHNTFGDDGQDYTTPELYRLVSERYEVFHIITGGRINQALETWEPLLPGRNAVIESQNIDNLAEVLISLMQLVGGVSKAETLSQWTGKTKEVVESAIKTINLG